MVFVQNLGTGGVLAAGDARSTCSWDPAHTFGLDGSSDATAGAEHEDDRRPCRSVTDR